LGATGLGAGSVHVEDKQKAREMSGLRKQVSLVPRARPLSALKPGRAPETVAPAKVPKRLLP